MFSRMSQLARQFLQNTESVRKASSWVFVPIHTSRRNAGHSEWANRKSSREEGAAKKALASKKIREDVLKEIRNSKNANLATNPKLQAILAEAKKNNVPQSVFDKALALGKSTLGRDSILSFTFDHPLGIQSIVQINSIQPHMAKSSANAVVKRFGFQFVGESESANKAVGVIVSKPLENVENAYDKALEDAIQANCQEVNKTEDGIEFQCDPDSLNACTNNLIKLGYSIDSSEIKFMFSELITIDDEAKTNALKKMEEKLQLVPGFIKVMFNVN